MRSEEVYKMDSPYIVSVFNDEGETFQELIKELLKIILDTAYKDENC